MLFVGAHDSPIQSSQKDQVQCLSHSRDQKFVMSSVKSAILVKQHPMTECHLQFTNSIELFRAQISRLGYLCHAEKD